jgi:predicted DNA-binding protein (MmcQ/YjbR family)
MTVEAWIQYCLSKPGAQETYPFDATTLVFKVGGKMFGLVYDHKGQLGLNLKGNPQLNLVLRQQYKGVIPGYHMNKDHWNTVLFETDVPDDEILRMVDLAYELVFDSLSKKAQIEALS